ncbi:MULTISPECIES: hypothetical protein [Mycolicibacterium]
MTFPTLNHVAVTVRDLAVSGPWYRALIGTVESSTPRTVRG